MVKRRVSPTETNIYETALTNSRKQETHRGVSTAFAVITGGLALSYLAVISGAGEAHADNHLVFGGRDVSNGQTDTSKQYAQFLINTHQINPQSDEIFPVPSPAGMIRQLDGSSMRESTDIAVANAQHILDTQVNPSEPTHLWGYSLGSAGALETAHNNEGRVDSVTLDKSPFGPGGLSNSEVAKDPEIKAMLDDNGIIISEPLPTDIPVNVNSNPADVFSGGGPLENVQAIVDSFMSTFNGPHDMSDPSQPHNVQHFGNVTVAWYGDNPIPAVTVDPVVAAVPEVLPAPVESTPEATTLVVHTEPVPDALPAPEAPAVETMRLSAPSSPGEPPCFTPEGVPYYTPADQPC